MLEQIKTRLGITSTVTIYDDELNDLIEHAKFDMIEGGISSDMIEEGAAPVINTIVLFIKREFSDDITRQQRYDRLYTDSVFRLSLYNEEEVSF